MVPPLRRLLRERGGAGVCGGFPVGGVTYDVAGNCCCCCCCCLSTLVSTPLIISMLDSNGFCSGTIAVVVVASVTVPADAVPPWCCSSRLSSLLLLLLMLFRFRGMTPRASRLFGGPSTNIDPLAPRAEGGSWNGSGEIPLMLASLIADPPTPPPLLAPTLGVASNVLVTGLDPDTNSSLCAVDGGGGGGGGGGKARGRCCCCCCCVVADIASLCKLSLLFLLCC